MPEALSETVIAGALGVAALLITALHLLLRSREQWLVVSLLVALTYILLSAAPRTSPPPPWELVLRWGLFLTAIIGLVRFRFWGRWPARTEQSD